MSLVRLLATGKSLVGLHDNESRYRVNSKKLLPKFNEQNPFGGCGVPASLPSQVAEGSPAVVPVPDMQEPTTEKLETRTPAPAKAEVKGFWSRWIERLRNLKRRKPAKAPSAIPRFDKTRLPVQAELSLERVKVVRNDLSESDLAIVTVSSTASRPRPARSIGRNGAEESAEPAREPAKLL
jgi:hypothetical protein